MRLRQMGLFILVSHLAFSSVSIAQNNNEIAVENYGPLSDHLKPLGELQALLDEGAYSKEVYMQLGYAYYQDGDLANAMLYYERAHRLAPRDTQVTEAIELIRSQIPIQITDIPDFVLWRMYQSTANIMDSTLWSALQLFLGFLLVGVTYLLLFRQGSPLALGKRWLIIGAIVTGIVFTSLMAYQRALYTRGGDTGISLDHQDLYEAPDDRSDTVTSIGPGNKVFLLDTIGDWYKVQLRDKDLGWVKCDRISTI